MTTTKKLTIQGTYMLTTLLPRWPRGETKFHNSIFLSSYHPFSSRETRLLFSQGLFPSQVVFEAVITGNIMGRN